MVKWYSGVVATLGCHSGWPRFTSPLRPGCTSSLLSLPSYLQDFINSSELKVAFMLGPFCRALYPVIWGGVLSISLMADKKQEVDFNRVYLCKKTCTRSLIWWSFFTVSSEPKLLNKILLQSLNIVGLNLTEMSILSVSQNVHC